MFKKINTICFYLTYRSVYLFIYLSIVRFYKEQIDRLIDCNRSCKLGWGRVVLCLPVSYILKSGPAVMYPGFIIEIGPHKPKSTNHLS